MTVNTQSWPISTSPRVFVSAGDVATMTVKNAGPSIVYYGSETVSSVSSVGSIASGASATVGAGQWFVSADTSRLFVTPVIATGGGGGDGLPAGGSVGDIIVNTGSGTGDWAAVDASVTAADIPFVPAGTVAADDVQAAVEEVSGDVTAHTGDTSAAHAASAISFSATGSVSATDVQAAIAEVASEAGGGGGTVYGIWKPADLGFLGATFDPSYAVTGTALAANGQLFTTEIEIATTGTAGHLDLIVTTAGATLTANQNFAWVYNSSGAIIGRCSAADTITAWLTAGPAPVSIVITPESAGSLDLTAGTKVRVGFYSNGTTRPSLLRAVATTATVHNIGRTTPNFRAGTNAGSYTTTIPAEPVTSGNQHWFWAALKA